jgi:hypothetical protein
LKKSIDEQEHRRPLRDHRRWQAAQLRDLKQVAIESAEYFKSMNPMVEVTVRDLEGIDATIVIPPQTPIVRR